MCFGMGTWVMKNSCPGTPRYRALSFTVNGKCYMGTGSTGGGLVHNRKDFWQFDPVSNYWTQVMDLPGNPRTDGTGCNTGNYGYVGLGYDNGTYLNDWWQYDPVNNTWVAKASFTGVARFGAEAFMINDRIYVGGGLDAANAPHDDFYCYDPVADTWNQKANMLIAVSSQATFVLNGKGYFVAGATNGSVSSTARTQMYDPTNNTWSSKAIYGGGATFSAIGFSIDGYGFTGTGFTGTITDMMWRYDPNSDSWHQETSFPTGIRQWAVSCTIGDKAYVGTGNAFGGNLYSDWWEFSSGFTGLENMDKSKNVRATYVPQSRELVVTNARPDERMRIYDVSGKLLSDKKVVSNESVEWDNYGVFIVMFGEGNAATTQKVVCSF